jgi:hypothetical protein
MKTFKFIVDIDNTICYTSDSDYANSSPIVERISHMNRHYDKGHHITYWTARGGNSGTDWTELTTNQLKEWGVKYHELKMWKPSYDFWIDDKALHAGDFFGCALEE